MADLTHINADGHISMVDVGSKAITQREAIARGRVVMQPNTLAQLRAAGLKKGDALGAARVAGIMGAKRTPELIPLCHQIPLALVEVDFSFEEYEDQAAVLIETRVRSTGKTGVEMEALTAVAVAGLTIYDMTKAIDKTMRIDGIRLVSKTGGQSGDLQLE